MQIIATGKPQHKASRISNDISEGQSTHKWKSKFSFMIINFSIKRCSITLVNEDKLYSMKPQRFAKVAVEQIYFTVMAIQSRHQ